MALLPKREPLSSQLHTLIKEEILSGCRADWLPSERHLATHYNVSRNTLRTALKTLSEANLIEAQHGIGYKIIQRPKRKSVPEPLSIGLLAPRPVPQLRPSTALWIDALRAELFKQGIALETHDEGGLFATRAASSLAAFTSRHKHTCWILLLSTAVTQNWFYRSGPPCIVAGTCHAGVQLASVDVDYPAQCRHAVGLMLAKGHRRIAFISSNDKLAGDRLSAEAFIDAAKNTAHTNITATAIHYDPASRNSHKAFCNLFKGKASPTAALIANPYLYLTCQSVLGEMGLRVAQDISLLSRDSEEFLTHLRPVPSRYTLPPKTFAGKILNLLRHLAANGSLPHSQIKILPEFERGDSLAALKPE